MSPEILDLYLKDAVILFEAMVALISLFFYRYYKNSPLRYFPFILWYTLINEFIGGSGIFEYNNVLIYNIYNLIYFLFFLYIFRYFVANTKYKNWIRISAVIYLFASVINPFFQNFITESQLFSYVLGACLLLFCIILYYIEILSTSQVLIINRELLFWISVGLLLFYVGYIPIKLTRVFFEFNNTMYLSLRIVHRLLIILMNISFIIGFLWMRRK